MLLEIFIEAGFISASAIVLIDQESKLTDLQSSEESSSENSSKLCRQVCHTTALMIDGQDGIIACRSFHSTGGFNAIVKLIAHSTTRVAAIELLERLTICDPKEGLTAILDLLKKENESEVNGLLIKEVLLRSVIVLVTNKKRSYLLNFHEINLGLAL
jgi:hypothetical protein